MKIKRIFKVIMLSFLSIITLSTFASLSQTNASASKRAIRYEYYDINKGSYAANVTYGAPILKNYHDAHWMTVPDNAYQAGSHVDQVSGGWNYNTYRIHYAWAVPEK
ncbi:hypothetical protein DY124_01300 [Apilactobacillus micheneri]|uniref:Uncharacterized protein n=1 Tax=Apilactobacillus micheneri TaxID=1899430 RepID=A0ABY2YX19_9LACO|nr:hypothetical protein [Apilactobacillus micheneri]TPR24555.1 hypothetical protein DY114_04565 [Apilactobacillus micheneri]TPR25866.1 hypothetical protein DY111_04565 [Apilactobacillus micheneri]TPR28056.1 hypothetical protein DY113_02510 [Apilactobacillus micheneri]TPR29547.1 hypothetical protein DY117_04565 [Apilactobacillus micheneri]TPR30333.1 hypothetical protein DY120_04565 [Apilactobacillus micheneri]